MGIFSSKNSYLGIDIGASSIKVAELANFKGRPRLVTYGFSERKIADQSYSLDAEGRVQETADSIMEICQKARTTSKKVIAALPNFLVFTSILNLPPLAKKELAPAISWEAKKIIPLPLEEIILDWKIITEPEEEKKKISVQTIKEEADFTGGSLIDMESPVKKIFSKPKKNLKILLTGANKKLVKKYVDIFNLAGLSLISLETESFALIRSLVGNDKTVIAVIDLGATSSSITVVDKGIPTLARSVEFGGLMITRSIANSLNVSLERAEQFKQDLSLDLETANNSLPQTVEKSFTSILNEIKYTINLYQEQNGKKIEKVILTGGSSLIGGLANYLARVLNINTYIGDPWARVIYPLEIKPILNRLGPKFSIAAGLAMRDIE